MFNDFNQPIDFKSLSADHIRQAADSVIAHARGEFQHLYAIPDGERTFRNTLLRMDDILNDVGRVSSVIYLMGNTHTDSLIRNTALETHTVIDKYLNELSLDENLYQAVKAFAQTAEAQKLEGYREKFLRETIENFERNGFALPKEDRDKLKEIKDAISETGNAFNKNIAAHQDHLLLEEKDLEGLPDDYKKARKQDDGKYKVDLSYPSYIPFMKYSSSDAARKQLFMKYNNRAVPENLDMLQELLRKRQEMAKLLGYQSYAEWRLEDRMARQPDVVWDFASTLKESVAAKAAQDYEELLQLKPESAGDVIQPWETAYLNNILLEEKYQLDNEKVKEYCPLDNVLDGLFKITQTLFGVTYREIENANVWHPEVRAFEVMDGDRLVGRFYLDLFPRENKFSHAACFGMIKGKMTPLGYQVPNATLVCNFPPPSENRPSLMPHDQAETLFHEFGHVLHQMLTTAELYAQSGTSVARDFVEAPSQIFENWVWNYESLELFAHHYETGEVLPPALFEKMIAARNVGSGLFVENQLYYGLIDMTLHDKYDPYGEKTTNEVVAELKKEITRFPHIDGTHFHAAFGHLNGYGAGYYGYLWSRVYAEDMFSIFEENGILNQETGMRYRNIILAKGSSEEPMDLVKEFLGRESNNEAFMRSLGL